MKLILFIFIYLFYSSLSYSQSKTDRILGNTEDEISNHITQLLELYPEEEKDQILDAIYILSMVYDSDEKIMKYGFKRGFTNEEIEVLKVGVLFKGRTLSKIKNLANKQMNKLNGRYVRDLKHQIKKAKKIILKNEREKSVFKLNHSKNIINVLDSTRVQVTSTRGKFDKFYHLECDVQVDKEHLFRYDITSIEYRFQLFNKEGVPVFIDYILIDNYTNDKWQRGMCYLIAKDFRILEKGTFTLQEYADSREMTFKFDIFKVGISGKTPMQINYDEKDKLFRSNLKKLYRQLELEFE